MGAGQRAPSGLIRYRLGDVAAARRAQATAAVNGATSLAPVALAIVLLNKFGWHPSTAYWAVTAALGVLVVVRAVLAYEAALRRLRSLVFLVGDAGIRVEARRDTYGIASTKIARIVEVDGALGGLRVESSRDPSTGMVSVVRIPRGGE